MNNIQYGWLLIENKDAYNRRNKKLGIMTSTCLYIDISDFW